MSRRMSRSPNERKRTKLFFSHFGNFVAIKYGITENVLISAELGFLLG